MAKVLKIKSRIPWHCAKSILSVVLLGVGAFAALLLLLRSTDVQARSEKMAQVDQASVTPGIYASCDANTTLYAAYQIWHGLPNHNLILPAPYRSDDDAVIARHLQAAKEHCVEVFVLDWYGPDAQWLNQMDRRYGDNVAKKLFAQAGQEMKIALMYDVGTLKGIPTTTLDGPTDSLYMTQVISDLIYARDNYLTQLANLQINDKPVLFIFPYEEFEPAIQWDQVREKLGIPITLISKAEMLTVTKPLTNGAVMTEETVYCDPRFDGLYAWVRPTNGVWDGVDWGEGYMKTFYTDMLNKCRSMIMIGGVWSGFDDRFAHWKVGDGRLIPTNCGGTWNGLWRLANQFAAQHVMLNTWNDVEEGTDVEFGVPKLLVTNNSPVLPGKAVTLTAQLADCQDVSYVWSLGDGVIGTGPLVTHTYRQFGNYMTVVTASNLTATVTASTTVVVSTTAWEETFNPLKSSWIELGAKWEDLPGLTAILCENNPDADFGKVESEVIRVNVTDYSWLVVESTAIDPDASYTIQLLDKSVNPLAITNKITEGNVITGVTQPGIQVVNFANIMKWHGPQTFTINVWISGEGKCATFKRIQLIHLFSVYLPLIQR